MSGPFYVDRVGNVISYRPDGIGGKIIDLDFNARSWNPVTPEGTYYGKGAFVESVAGAVERKKATGKRAYIYEGAGSTRQDPTYVLDKKYSRNKRSVGHTYDSDNFYVTKALNPANNPLWRNPQQLSFGEEKMSYAEKVDAMSPREFAVHLKNERRAMDLRKLEVTARIEARKQNE